MISHSGQRRESRVDFEESIPHCDLILFLTLSVHSWFGQRRHLKGGCCCCCHDLVVDALVPPALCDRFEENDKVVHVVAEMRETETWRKSLRVLDIGFNRG